MTIRTERYHKYDVMKAICIIFVIITHFKWTDLERMQYGFAFWLDMAIPVFMILSGYLWANSYSCHDFNSFWDAFDSEYIIHKILRFSIPYIFIYVIDMLYLTFVENMDFGIVGLIFRFFQGGFGPGSFYYPCMIQLIFIFPFVYILVKKYNTKGLWICGVLNIVFEFLQRAYQMDSALYRLLVFRYLLLIAFGTYLHLSSERLSLKKNIILFCIGTAFLICTQLGGYKPLILRYWTSTSCIAVLPLLPMLQFFIDGKDYRLPVLEIIGRASYQIFLVQMLLFNAAHWLYDIYPSRIVHIPLMLFLCLGGGDFVLFD